MSKQANPAVIGVFAVGAVVLVVAALILFGGGRFFAEKQRYVLYFDGAVTGLRVGAPVLFQGVPMGEVADIVATFDKDDPEQIMRIAVYVDIRPDSVRHDAPRMSAEENYKVFVEEAGVKARLHTDSLVTGLLSIQLDYFPDQPIKLRGRDPEVLEIPTIPSTFDDLTRKFEGLPIEQIATELLSVLEGADDLVHDPLIKETLAEAKHVLSDVRTLTQSITDQVEPFSSSLIAAAEAARGAFAQTEKSMALEGEGIAAVIADWKETTATLRGALIQAQKTLATVDDTISDERIEVANTLQEVAAAARSIRVLADYLEQNPDALLRGKGQPGI